MFLSLRKAKGCTGNLPIREEPRGGYWRISIAGGADMGSGTHSPSENIQIIGKKENT
jgi:hypothetical protein